MFNVLMVILGGRQGRWRGSGGAVCRHSAPWRIGLEKVSDTLVENKMTKKEKIKPPFQALEDVNLGGLPFPTIPAFWWGGGAPWLVSSRGFTYRLK